MADDAYLVREGLRQLLELSDAVVVVGGCVDEPQTLAAVDADPPDVLVTDIRMPPTFTDEGIRHRRGAAGDPTRTRSRRAEPGR